MSQPRAAVIESVATSGRSVAVSGLTVVVALAGMFLVDIQGFRSMAVGTMVVVTLAVLASLTLLPAVLMLIGRADRPVHRAAPVQGPASDQWLAPVDHAGDAPPPCAT